MENKLTETFVTVICGKETLIDAVQSRFYPATGDLLDMKGTLYKVSEIKCVWSPYGVGVLVLVCEIPPGWYAAETKTDDEIF
jgi:hypothetical protein